jgi:hypothetical protein
MMPRRYASRVLLLLLPPSPSLLCGREAGVVASPLPFFDKSNPDANPGPRSNSELGSPPASPDGAAKVMPTGAGGVALPWLQGLLTDQGMSLLWDGKSVIPSGDAQTCRWGRYICYDPPINGDRCRGGFDAGVINGAPATALKMCLHQGDMISNSIACVTSRR